MSKLYQEAYLLDFACDGKILGLYKCRAEDIYIPIRVV